VLVHFHGQQQQTSQILTAPTTKRDGNTTGIHPYTPSFEWWAFNATIPSASVPDLAGFTVSVVDTDTSGREIAVEYNNGGGGFPLETAIIPQRKLSCGTAYMGNAYIINVTVAVSSSSRHRYK